MCYGEILSLFISFFLSRGLFFGEVNHQVVIKRCCLTVLYRKVFMVHPITIETVTRTGVKLLRNSVIWIESNTYSNG